MKVSWSWLSEFVDLEFSPSDVANLLTMAGVEVKEIKEIGKDWNKVVVGEIKNISPHPHADRLKLVEVNVGNETMTVVCGAPNLRRGDKVPFAHIGAKIIHPEAKKMVTLDKASIRGVSSYGMICSEQELGISENHDGVMELPLDAEVGKTLSSLLSDTILDLDVTPNRPDLLSVIGVAREIAALTGKRMRYPHIERKEGIPSEISVDIVFPELCPRYCCAEIYGFKITSSPLWLRQRLSLCGVRPITNIVDITNYVMLEYGQPLHAFDRQKLRGKRIIVRPAKAGETLITLDGKGRDLSPDILVIADEYGAVALAGIMGGEESGIGDETTSLLLESANFNPQVIRRGSRNLNLRTEASLRFEKGLPEATAPEALLRAQNLMQTIAGGRAKSAVDVYYPKEERKPIFFFPQEIGRLAGIKVEVDKVKNILSSLEIPFEEDKEALRVYPPPWRKDLNLPCDLVEEVCRIQGYDSIPALSLSSPIPHHKFHPLIDLKEKVKDILISCGMQEVITYSLVSEEKLLRFPSPFWPHQKPLRVKNPLTSDQEYLRTSILPSLLSTLNFNQRQGANRINLFEVGRVYLPRKDKLPCEKEFVAGIMWGRRFPFSWLSPEESFDFFDAKGIVERLMENLAVEAEFTRSDEQNILGAKIAVQEDMIGILGEIHPRIRNNFDLLPGAVWAFEIDLVRLLTHLKVRKFSPLPRFPSAIRDLSFLLPREITAGKVKDIIVNSSSLVSEVTLFDVYTGEGIPKDRKSLSFRIVYQSSSHTLNDGEIKEVENSIIHRLEKEVGAILRGSEG